MSGWEDMVPKRETGAAALLEAQPTADGRGVIVAVLDTGVDPGAAGLQVTPDGSPKLIDIIDCTGDGDVKCSTKVTTAPSVQADDRTADTPETPDVPDVPVDSAEADGGELKSGDRTIKGLSGRSLKLNPAWENPTGVWRLGLKRGYELFPNPLKKRLTAEAKKEWDIAHGKVVAGVMADLAGWAAANPETTKLTPAKLREKEDLDGRREYLNSFTFEDPGPIYDVIAWHDGRLWRAAVDVGEEGDLSTAEGLAPYSVEGKYASFGKNIQLNYTLTVYDNGKIVNICADAGSHGSHVSGIIGAYRPDNPELNGVAPGCQILALKIGDIRLDAMETSTALCRALAECVKYRVDLMNLSYGEATSVTNTGFFVDMASKVVNKHGCIFFSSAGNAGPALSSAGAPGATTESIIGVGAYVNEAMMKTCYSMPKKDVAGYETNYTWSSVGPAADGGAGITIVAPGGAITCIPNWTLAKSQLMNGTSMSSPNACGSAALLLSAMKQKGLPISKPRVLRAVCNTAAPLEVSHPRAQGCGVVQVHSALDYLQKWSALGKVEDVDYIVKVSQPGQPKGRGIYLRNDAEVDVASVHTVTVEPKMHEDSPKEELTSFECKIELESDAPEWVIPPERFVLAASPRAFKVTVDPTGLNAGYHTAHVFGYDSENRERGPLFRVPVTIGKPLPMTRLVNLKPSLVRGTPARFFLTPPSGSTWMDINISLKKATPVMTKTIIVLHTMQMVPHRNYDKSGTRTYLRFGDPGEYDVVSRKVDGQSSVELCFALYWSELDHTELNVDVTFHGIEPSSHNVTITPGSGYSRVDLASSLGEVSVQPSGTLNTWGTPIRPNKSEVYPLSSRHDLLDGVTLHELRLSYTFTADEATTITPRCRLINDRVYETEVLGGPFIFVLDKRKKVLGHSDIYAAGVKVPEGEITLVAYLRHPSAKLLNNYLDLPITVERALAKSIKLKVYASPGCIVAGKSEISKQVLGRGATLAAFVAEPDFSALPKSLKPGDILSGPIQYSSTSSKKLGDGNRPDGYSVTYFAPPAPKKAPEVRVAQPQDNLSEADKMSAAIKKLKITTVKNLVGKDGFDAIHDTIAAEFPNELELAAARLHHLDAGKGNEAKAAVIEQADTVIALIDTDKLAQALGRQGDPDDPEGVKAREAETSKKEILVDALNRKALALVALAKIAEGDATIRELKQWDKIESNEKLLRLSLASDTVKCHYGKILKLARKQLQKPEGPHRQAVLDTQRDAFEKLGWTHIAAYEAKWELIRSPPSGVPPY